VAVKTGPLGPPKAWSWRPRARQHARLARGEAGVSAPAIERRGRRAINVRDRAYLHLPAPRLVWRLL